MTPEEYIKREQEIQEAVKEFPDLEMGEAYTKWKELRGEKGIMLSTGDKELQITKAILKKSARKPCTQEGCKGTMTLESVCGGCAEGKKGWKSKWVCEECLHREFSKKDYMEILRELTTDA